MKNSGYTGNFTNYSDWYRKVFLFRRYVLNIFIKEFNTTVNIVTKPEIADKTIIELQKIANRNDLSFIKEEYIP